MAFSNYLTSASVNDSRGSIIGSITYSASNASGSFSVYDTVCPTSTFRSYTAVNFTASEAFNSTQSAYTSFSGKSCTFHEEYTEGYSDPVVTAGSSSLTEAILLNSTATTSDFPYKTFVFTSSTSSTNYFFNYSTSGGTSSSGSTSFAGDVMFGGTAEYFLETFTFTSSYAVSTPTTTEGSTTIFFGTDEESTTYEVLTYVFTQTNSLSGVFDSIRPYDFIHYLSPVNISRSYNLSYFRDISPNFLSLFDQTIVRGFTTTGESLLISDYDFLVNQTISTSYSVQDPSISLGATVNTNPDTVVTLTTNSISVIPQTTTLTSQAYWIASEGTRTLSFHYSTSSFEYSYESYQEVSDTLQYTLSENWFTSNLGSGYTSSAYSTSIVVNVLTTKTFLDISCNSISHILYTKSDTLYTTSSARTATNVYLILNTSTTQYAYASVFPLSFSAIIQRPFNFYTFSSQKMLFGNFVKNISDETAYWGLNLASFGGIYDFSCVARRDYIQDPFNYGVPKFYRYPDCTVSCDFDPISTTLSSVRIIQSVSSNLSDTTISQSVYWSTTSSTRTFMVQYSESSGTMPFTYDLVNDFDSRATFGYLGADQSQAVAITLTPIDSIMFSNIYNTYGQMAEASYMVDGAYFKANSSEISFVSTTYTNPISIEGIYADDSIGTFSIYRVPYGGDAIATFTKPLLQFNNYFI